MINIAIIIPTYNRPWLLEKLIWELYYAARGEIDYVVHYLIFDDHSDRQEEYLRVLGSSQLMGDRQTWITYERMPFNHGRGRFFELWTKMLQAVREEEFEYVVALGDDMKVAPDFFSAAITAFEGYRERDPNVVAMNLFPAMKAGWGHKDYLDGAFIARREFFDLIDWHIPEPQKSRPKNPLASSGIGKFMTNAINDGGGYQIAPNEQVFAAPRAGVASVMFPGRKGETWAKNLQV